MSAYMSIHLLIGVKFNKDEFIKKTRDPLFGQCNFNPRTGDKVTQFIETQIHIDESRAYDKGIERIKPYCSNDIVIGYDMVDVKYDKAIYEIDPNTFTLTDEQINELIDTLAVVRPVSKDEIKVYLIGIL